MRLTVKKTVTPHTARYASHTRAFFILKTRPNGQDRYGTRCVLCYAYARMASNQSKPQKTKIQFTLLQRAHP